MSQRPTIYVDMDDVLCDFTAAYRHAKQSQPAVGHPQSVPGFFANLAAVDGAIDAVNGLRRDFDVFVLSAPSTRNPHSYAEKRIWIEEHFDYAFTKRLILSPDKGLLKGQFLIDDNVRGKGQERFEGELIHFGSERFPDWDTVLAHLRGVASVVKGP